MFRRAFAALFSFAALVGLFHQFFGPPWPTKPVIVPGLPADTSAFVVPFTVTNRSALFDIHEAKVDCVIVEVVTNNNVIFRGIGVPGIVSSIPADSLRTLKCSMADTKDQDAAIFMDGAHFVRAKIYFVSSYFVLNAWKLSFTHGPYSWDAAIKPPRWIEGPALEQPQN